MAPEAVRLAVAEGVELAADVWAGSRPPFLLLHGLASSRQLWRGAAEHLAAAGHAVATLDLRGHGESDKPASGYDFETMAADVVAAVRMLGFDRPAAIGQSYGGNLVLEVADRHPDAVRGIAAVDGGILDFGREFSTWEECESKLAPPQFRLTLDELRRRISADESEFPPGAVKAVMACFEEAEDGTARSRLARANHLAILKSMWEHGPIELLERVATPVFVIPCDTGDEAWTAHKRDSLEAVSRYGLPLRVQWFTAHHDVHLQRPEQVAEALLSAERDGFFA